MQEKAPGLGILLRLPSVSLSPLGVGLLGCQLDTPVTGREVLPNRVQTGSGASVRPRGPVRPPGGRAHGSGSAALSRDIIQLTFMSSNFRCLSVSMMLHRREVPAFISDILLEGHVPSILGDDGDPEGEGTTGPLCLSSRGSVPPPQPGPLDCSSGVASG